MLFRHIVFLALFCGGGLPSPFAATASFAKVQRSDLVRLSFPADARAALARDPVNGVQFEDACSVDIRDRGEVYTRFSIHVPDQSYRTLARKAGGFLAIVWQLANDRFGALCPRLRAKTIDVWITRSGDAGGELKQENVYVYKINADRSGLEWARELAHEYGHYLLPGASGYSEPENWSNGLLGERLFLYWLVEELRSKRLDPEDLPFGKLEELELYCAKQPVPLIERVRTSGINPSVMAKNDRHAMDAFTALLLYADRTYGSASIMEMMEYLPKDRTRPPGGAAFLKAFQTWLAAKRTFYTSLPSNRTTMLYFPLGEYTAARAAVNPGARGAAGPHIAALNMTLTIKTPGWTPVKIGDAAPDVRLQWTRVTLKSAHIRARK